jgi:hypothetical protein
MIATLPTQSIRSILAPQLSSTVAKFSTTALTRQQHDTPPFPNPRKPSVLDRLAKGIGYTALFLVIIPGGFLIVFPPLVGIVFPSLITVFVVGAIAMVMAVVFSALLPVVLVALLAGTIPTYGVYTELKSLRDSGYIDPEKWEVVQSPSNEKFIMEGDALDFDELDTDLEEDKTSKKMKEKVRGLVDLYLDLGEMVERHLEDLEMSEGTDLGNNVVLRAKESKVAWFNKNIQMPFDRTWLKANLKKRAERRVVHSL